MDALLLALAIAVPTPVSGAGGGRLSDGTVMLHWLVPADPAVAGIAVVREPVSGGGGQTFLLSGVPASLHDTSVSSSVSYRYSIFTYDGFGVWSSGAIVIITFHDVDEDGEVHFFCASAAGIPGGAAPAALLAAFLAAFLLRRRAP